MYYGEEPTQRLINVMVFWHPSGFTQGTDVTFITGEALVAWGHCEDGYLNGRRGLQWDAFTNCMYTAFTANAVYSATAAVFGKQKNFGYDGRSGGLAVRDRSTGRQPYTVVMLPVYGTTRRSYGG